MENEDSGNSKLIEIIYYTDPYCTWCWGSEPILRHLMEVFGDQIEITYKMGGLVEDIEEFYDPTNDISSIDQVAPHWAEASTSHGMPVDIAVFDEYKDEIKSTFPANVAYKAAELQDAALAVKYLRRLREGAAAERLPIHRRQTQIDLAAAVGLDTDKFTAVLDNGEAEAAFRADLNEARGHGITGFPTFAIRNKNNERVTLHGYQSFDNFANLIDRVNGIPLKRNAPRQVEDFINRYERVATREIMEVYGVDRDTALEALLRLEQAGKTRKVPAGNGEFWESKRGRSSKT